MKNSETVNEEKLTIEQQKDLEYMREKLIIGLGLTVAQVENMNYNMASIQLKWMDERSKKGLL